MDEKNEIITATTTTAGDVNEVHEMISLVDQHEKTKSQTVAAVIADSKFGTIDNYLACHDRGLLAHMADFYQSSVRKKRLKIFTEA